MTDLDGRVRDVVNTLLGVVDMVPDHVHDDVVDRAAVQVDNVPLYEDVKVTVEDAREVGVELMEGVKLCVDVVVAWGVTLPLSLCEADVLKECDTDFAEPERDTVLLREALRVSEEGVFLVSVPVDEAVVLLDAVRLTELVMDREHECVADQEALSDPECFLVGLGDQLCDNVSDDEVDTQGVHVVHVPVCELVGV